MSSDEHARAVILDVDGTLVDSNFHHSVAWSRAFRRCGIEDVEIWRIHRSIGMGSDRLVAAVAGEDVEERAGDDVRDAESEAFGELIDEIQPLPGAAAMVRELGELGADVVLASSAPGEEVEHYVELLGIGEHCEWTSSSDVSDSKPAPDLVAAALERTVARPAVMLGDTVWDCEAARRAGIASAAVLSGGFGRAELLDAGAGRVYDSPQAVRDDLLGLLALPSAAADRR